MLFDFVIFVSWIHGALLAAGLWNKGKYRDANRFFVLLLINVLAVQTLVTLPIIHPHPEWRWMGAVCFPMGLMTGSLILFYVLSVLSPAQISRRLIGFHLLPVIAGVVWSAISELAFPTPPLLNNGFPAKTLEDILKVTSVTVLLGVYLGLAAKLVFHGSQPIVEPSPRGKSLPLKWLRFLVSSFAVLWGILFASLLLGVHGEQWLWVPIGHTLLVLSFGFFTLRHSSVFLEPSEDLQPFESPKKVVRALDAARLEARRQKLEELMRSQKPYTQAGLKLSDLADRLSLRVQETSELINQGTGMTFYEFLNFHRVEEVKRRFLEPQFHHMSIIGIALDCGFNSKSVFNEAFKELTGVTPSEYRKNLSETETKAT